jgi:hypothetical protein
MADYQDMQRTMERTVEDAGRYGEEMAHRGRQASERGHRAVERGADWLASEVLVMAAGASVIGSLALKIAGRPHDALFVGQWAPTLVGLAVFTRLIQTHGAR